jgi:hypothetical protein
VQITIQLTALHRLDLETQTVERRSLTGPHADFSSYLLRLVVDMYSSARARLYRFPSTQTEVASLLTSLSAESWAEHAQIIAERLLRIELATQERIAAINALRVGSLVQILAEIDGVRTAIITKVDHSDFLDEASLITKLGLPIRQRAQKTAIISFEDEVTIREVRVADTNSKISEYWWQQFLEAAELRSAEKNTMAAFSAIDNVLRRSVRPHSNSDFWTLRNAVITFFRTNVSCAFDRMVEQLLDEYVPDSDDVNTEMLAAKLLELPQRHRFDSQFELAPRSINVKIRRQIQLAENLELRITGEIQGLRSLIDTGEETDGRKYIRIFSDAGYSEFYTATDDRQ